MSPLAPLSFLYDSITSIRNKMFDNGLLAEHTFDITTICVGNLAVGGTGKTPHTEWIVSHLIEKGTKVAILSRGYGRSTKGYIEATPTLTACDIGDEPFQMYHHFGTKVPVAVCEKRVNGIRLLQKTHPELQVIVLDDAFQHRHVKASLNVLLTDYSHPYFNDRLLPSGRLRENVSGAKRADIIIVTKCPPGLDVETSQRFINSLHPTSEQKVFFSSIIYKPLEEVPSDSHVVVLTGIASSRPLVEKLQADQLHILRHLEYADHHTFSKSDITTIEEAAEEADFIITTAKDHARLLNVPLTERTKQKIKVQHIGVELLFGQESTFLNHLQLC